MTGTTERVEGTVDSDFDEVRDVLAACLGSEPRSGMACAVYHRGRRVVDVWGGAADRTTGRRWTGSTLVPLTSISKTVLVTTLLRLVEFGELDLDAPVARYWPGFGHGGKQNIDVRTVLSHRAGIPHFPDPVTLADELAWDPVVSKIERLQPIWTPGRRHGYHAIVLGFVMFTLIARVTGRPAGDVVRELVIDRMGLDLHLSIDGSGTDRLTRTHWRSGDEPPSEPAPELREYVTALCTPDSLFTRATFGSTAMTSEDMNNPAYQRAVRPTAYGTADALARMYAALVSEVDGCRLLNPATVDAARAEHASGTDEVFRVRTRWGVGFMLPGGPLWPDVGRRAIGHIGSTGALAFADPEAELSFTFLTSEAKSLYEVPDRRARMLSASVYRMLKLC